MIKDVLIKEAERKVAISSDLYYKILAINWHQRKNHLDLP
jgi:hypothetical protein